MTNITQLMQISLLIYDYRVFPGLSSKVSSFYRVEAGLIRHHFWDIPNCLKMNVKKKIRRFSAKLGGFCGKDVEIGLFRASKTTPKHGFWVLRVVFYSLIFVDLTDF